MKRLALVSAAIGIGTDAGYLLILHGQSASDGTLRSVFVAVVIAVASLAAATARLANRAMLQRLLLAFAAAVFLILGVLSLFSIGMPLIAAGVVASVAELNLRGNNRPAAIAATCMGLALAVAVALAGLQWTSYPVQCPSPGDSAGSGNTFFGSSFSWTCHAGHITVYAAM